MNAVLDFLLARLPVSWREKVILSGAKNPAARQTLRSAQDVSRPGLECAPIGWARRLPRQAPAQACPLRTCPRTRSGSSLVEVMAAMAGNAAIVSLALVCLIALGRADRAFRDRAEARGMASRLAEQLREDVHAAEQMTWAAKQQELQLTLPGDEAIVYQGEKQQWARRTISNDNQAGDLAGAFAAPRRFRLQVEPDSAAAGEMVTITFKIRSQDRPDDDGVATELVAEVGRNRRLVHE